MLTRKKIQGMFLGGAIGDALGRPVECMSFTQAMENYPEGVRTYLRPNNNKWFKDEKTGVITDDTQLSLAVVLGLLEAKGFSMPAIAKYHVKALQKTVEGWAPTTKEAVQRLESGISWKESGKTDNLKRGAGNGVVMKVSPLGAYHAIQKQMKWFRFADRIVEFSAMTHYTRNSAIAAVVHSMAIAYLLWADISYFSKDDFWEVVKLSCNGKDVKRGRKDSDHFYVGNLPPTAENYPQIADKLDFISCMAEDKKIPTKDLISYYENGDSQVINSLPFSYAFFLKNPYSVESIFNVVWMGGDADTNAKIVGEMIGALHGVDIFLTKENIHLVDGLDEAQNIIQLADDFCDCFGVNS